jgi:hypothetical protein
MLRGKGRRGTPLSGGMCAAHFLKPFQAQSKNQPRTALTCIYKKKWQGLQLLMCSVMCDVHCLKITLKSPGILFAKNCMNYGKQKELCMFTELFLCYFYYVYNIVLNYFKCIFEQFITYSTQNLKHVWNLWCICFAFFNCFKTD